MATPDGKIFWLGTRGNMIPLAVPDGSISRSETKIGASDSSLNGTTTESIRGFRRAWDIGQAYLSSEDLAVLEALYTGILSGNVYLIDPLSPNRLSRSTAVGSKTPEWVGASYNWYEVGSPAVAASAQGDTPTIDYTSVDGQEVSWKSSHFVRWGPTSSSAVLYAESDHRFPLRRECPVIPSEELTLKGYARGTGAVSAQIEFLSLAGTPVGTSTAATVNSATWAQFTTTATAPSDAVAARIRLNATNTEVHDFCRFQLGVSSAPWTPGGGSALVTVASLDQEAPFFPLVSASVTLQEI